MRACPGLRPGGVLHTCHSAYRTAAFHVLHHVGFPLSPGLSNDHDYTFFGAQYRACTLDPSGSRLPSPGLPADFTTDPLDRLWSGGTFLTSTPGQALQEGRRFYGRPITHWVTLSNFKDLSYSDDSDLARREQKNVRSFFKFKTNYPLSWKNVFQNLGKLISSSF